MAFTSANQPQLIRSCQKDEQFQGCLRGQAHEACQAFTGAKKWLQWRKEIELLCDLTYYTLTTFSGNMNYIRDPFRSKEIRPLNCSFRDPNLIIGQIFHMKRKIVLTDQPKIPGTKTLADLD
ncbi:peroxisome biogenesis factor 10 [Mantella aurantiaca]